MALTALGQIILPNVRVEERGSDTMDFFLGSQRLGSISLSLTRKAGVALESWYAWFARSSLVDSELVLAEDTRSGPFRTPAAAVRSLLQADNRPSVKFEGGIAGDDQQSSFMNATLQHAGTDFEFSVATNLEIPSIVLAEGKEAITSFIKSTLRRASTVAPGLAFDVQFGPAGSSEDD
jgi:hypothetical protein